MNYFKKLCLFLAIAVSPLLAQAAVTEYTPHTWDDAGAAATAGGTVEVWALGT